MKTLTIPTFIQDLNELTSSFEGKSLSEYKHLLGIADRAFDLVHGRRAERENNYRLLPIEKELTLIVFDLRRRLLKKICEDRAEYEQKEPNEIWPDFKLASGLDYGSFGCGGIGWEPGNLAKDAKDMLADLCFNKLIEKLAKKNKAEEKTKLLKILKDLQDHYNHSHQNHKTALRLLKRFDTKEEFLQAEYFA